MGCLGAVDFVDEQRCVRTSRWSAYLQLLDWSRGFALCSVVHVRDVSEQMDTVCVDKWCC
jgi:hypothetical protein